MFQKHAALLSLAPIASILSSHLSLQERVAALGLHIYHLQVGNVGEIYNPRVGESSRV